MALDSMAHLFARLRMLSTSEMGMIGRMSAGWAEGRLLPAKQGLDAGDVLRRGHDGLPMG